MPEDTRALSVAEIGSFFVGARMHRLQGTLAGCDVTWTELPSLGILGNSHAILAAPAGLLKLVQ